MHEPINLVLFSNSANDAEAGIASHLYNLVQFLRSRPDMCLTTIETDHQAAKRVTYQETGNTAMLSIPQPENKLFLSSVHSLQQMVYARRLADILYPYLQNKTNLIFWANSVDYVRVFEILKERYNTARFIYVHQEWSWKRYLSLPDNIFSEYWNKGDITLSRRAFELTAYEQRMALIVDKIVTVSNQATGFFTGVLDISPHKITIIRNGAAYPGAPEYTTADLRNSFGFSENEKIILYAGNITHEGGIYYLMEAFKKIAGESENIRLLIAGEGDYCRLLALAKPQWSKVVFTGKLSVSELNKLILLADIGIVPSLYGQCSCTALNMRFHKLPLIISAIDGLDESFEDGVDSLKINILRNEKHEPEIDVTQLAQKIRLLLTDKKLAEMLSENSYNIAMEKFGLNKMCNRYLDLLYAITQQE